MSFFKEAARVSLVMTAIAPITSAWAQSFDCTKAQTPTERAICRIPSLAELDQRLATAYARASAQAAEGNRLQDLRTTQRDWVSARDRTCGTLPASRLEACVAESYRTRIAVLETRASAQNQEQLPAETVAPSASLVRNTVPANAAGETLVTVTAPGRFAITATSSTGVALQLVDMIAGPGEISGDAGSRDGRLDVLLDKGTYKLRTFGAKDGKGDATLAIAPFQAAAPASRDLLRGGTFSGELPDLQQRSFWILVDKSQKLSVEAIGRSLQDLRAWRNGTELSELTPSASTVETQPAKPMTRLRLDGALEPGLYLVTVYGGAPVAWTNGDTDQPFHIRSGAPAVVASGWFEGSIGPFGSLRLQVPAPATHFRLELPEPASVRLSATRGAGVNSTSIARNSREPVASLNLALANRTPATVEINGFEGQAVRLRALQPASSLRTDGAGQHLVTVSVAGEGGDEIPAQAMLAKFERNTGTVLSSSAPRIVPGTAWRKRFNLRGTTTLLFEITTAGPVAATAEGPAIRASLSRVLGGQAPQADARNALQWTVEPGWYLLRLDPQNNAQGVLDLTFGQPGFSAQVQANDPPRTSIDLGLHTFERNVSYQVFTNAAPGLVTGISARALPADLAQGALIVPQPDRATAASNAAPAPEPIKAVPAPAPAPAPAQSKPPTPQPSQKQQQQQRRQTGTAQKPPAKPLVAAKPQPLPPRPAPVSLPARTATADGSLELPVIAPATGRIVVTDVTSAAVDVTHIGEIIENNLRRLSISVPATEKARTIVIAHQAQEPAAPLPPVEAQQARTTLAATQPFFFDLDEDARRSFSLDIPAGGLYRVETLGRLVTEVSVSTPFLPKLDSAKDNGAGRNALLQTYLRAGSYRIDAKVSDSRGRLGVVARPAPMLDAGTLVAGASARATLEAGSGATFGLDIKEAGSYRLDLYGLGRTFTARLEDAEGWPLTVPGKLEGLTQDLQPGRYRLVVLPQAVDARVVARLSKEETPAEPTGHGPHALPFNESVSHEWREPSSRDAPRVPDRWTFELFGPTHARLEIGDGMAADVLVEGASAPIAKIVYKRGFDGTLQAGRYTVEARALGRNDRLEYTLSLNVDEMQPGMARFVKLPASVPISIEQDRVVSLTSFGRKELTGTLRDDAGNIIERFTGRADDWNVALSRILPGGRYRVDLSELTATVDSEARTTSDDEEQETASNGEPDSDSIELRLDLPPASAVAALRAGETASLKGPRVHRLSLPAVDSGQLAILGASAGAELVLVLERQLPDGTWRTLSSDRGRRPLLAFESDGQVSQPWRLAVWSLDGGDPDIRVHLQTLQPQDQSPGDVALSSVSLDAIGTQLQVASVKSSGRQALMVSGEGLQMGSRPGRPIAAEDAGVQSLQSDRLWILSRHARTAKLRVAALSADVMSTALALRAGDAALLPGVAAASDGLVVWRAQSSFGQPGIDAGQGMGIAAGSAIALAHDARDVRVWNAGSPDGLRLAVDRIGMSLRPAVSMRDYHAAQLPSRSAQSLSMVPGLKELRLSLAPGTIAHLSGDGRKATIWTGDAPVSRQVTGTWTQVTLMNLGATSAPVEVAMAPAASETTLASGQVLKRFFGASGQISVPVTAAAGDRLIVAGAEATFVGKSGRVQRGRSIAPDGDGELLLDHPVGLVVAWIENERLSPWATAMPEQVTLPRALSLSGNTKSVALRMEQPALLSARTTAPVIVGLKRPSGSNDAPELFASGAEFHRYVPAGDQELRLYAPQDGPLTGELQLSALPIIPAGEGLGADYAMAPGASLLFGFEIKRAASVGFGLRSTPDRATARLLDANGTIIAEGIAQMKRLEPGRYILQARAPADGETLTVRPAIIGITPPDSGPPPDVARRYLELVGLFPTRSR